MSIISWFNENQGFTAALLSVLTLITSIIAVVVSIRTARMPFTKKVYLRHGPYTSNTVYASGLFVSVVNIGNININLRTVGLMINGRVCVNQETISDSQKVLGHSEETTQYFPYSEIQEILWKNQNSNIAVFAYAEDSEGKQYKKKIDTVDQIIRFFSS